MVACGDGNSSRSKGSPNGPNQPLTAPIQFVQVAYATPQSNSASVTVKYAAAQTARSLNVLAVGWNDTTATVTSVTDTMGNSYVRAVGPTMNPGAVTQSIYYAKNIAAAAAGGNSVTVRFSVPAVYVDVRILEYSGLDTAAPLDVAAGAAGSAATNDSGALTTTGPNELLFAANITTGFTDAAGTGFTSRVITSPDSDIAEDRVLATAGTYHGTAPGLGVWVMQAVAFRSMPVQPPSAPGNLRATAVSSTEIDLAWTASTPGSQPTASYRVERCQRAGCTTFAQIATPTGTSYADTSPAPATSYSYRVLARDTSGNVSPYSNVASATTPPDTRPPSVPANLTATAVSSSRIDLSWSASTDNVAVTGYAVERCQGPGCASFVQIATPATPGYSDTGLQASTSYSYRLRATDAAGNFSDYSAVASATTPAPAQPPTPPANLAATPVSTSQINLSWTASTSSVGIANYLVERCQGAGCASFAQIATPAGTSYGDTGLLAATTYAYRVRAADTAGKLSDYSNTASAATFAPPPSSGAKFVQVAYATPQSNSVSVTIRYGAAQSAGNLNVVAVGWNDTTSTVTSVTDTMGNGYLRAVGPTANPGAVTQSIYYAKNIAAAAAGANSVTVNFNVAAVYVDVRVLEYSGLDPAAPVDATAAAFGSAVSNDSGPLTTTGSNELLFAANITTGDPSAPGTGFTSRVITDPDSDIAEDQIAATPGTYRGTATGSGYWVMQMVAFRTSPTLAVSPRTATLTPTRTQQFTTSSSGVTWSVNGIVGGSVAVGTISSGGLYTPPSTVGSYTVTATTSGSPPASASATAYVTNYPGTFTYHYDNLRTGANLRETVLTPTNVQSQFGPLFNVALDGVPQASPLYVAGVNVAGVVRNVVYVATEHDSVYAIDADGLSNAPLWKRSFINPGAGITTVPACDTGECNDISPEIGITGTPVIDPGPGTLYVVAKTKEVSGGSTSYVHRLHALDIFTGAEKLGGPVTIQASVNGTGDGTDGAGHVPLIVIRENQRPALTLGNGIVYIAFASHGDISPWHGWVLGYNANSLAQVFAYNVSANGFGGGIWQSGSGPGVDASGNIFLISGNGTFDGNSGGVNFSDSFLKLSPGGALADWFTPHDQATFGNVELSSGGPLLLPDQPGAHPHLVLGAGKGGNLYVVDRDAMGHFNAANDNQIVQELVNIFPKGVPEAFWTAPVVFGNRVYFGPNNDTVQAFSLTNGLLSTAPVSHTTLVYDFPGAMMSVSANGTANGILWSAQRTPAGPGVLHAYDPLDLTKELYSGALPDVLTKFTTPTVANGRVYVATLSQLAVFGLLP